MMRRDVFQAIADPTRREIIAIIAHNNLTLNAVADRFPVSRQAISKHIRILEECGLIRIRKQGRERMCVAHLETLHEISDWVGHYTSFWTEKLDALERHIMKDTEDK